MPNVTNAFTTSYSSGAILSIRRAKERATIEAKAKRLNCDVETLGALFVNILALGVRVPKTFLSVNFACVFFFN